MKKTTFFLLIGLSCLACIDIPEADSEMAEQEEHFFDLEGYMEQEVDRLEANDRTVKKVISINGEQEQHSSDAIDFDKELAVFINSDINKTSWFDKYTIDSTFSTAGELTRLTYTAQDKKLKTRQLIIHFEGEEVNQITIDNSSGTTLAKMQQQLSYTPAEGYRIQSRQEILLFKNREMLIDASFFR